MYMKNPGSIRWLALVSLLLLGAAFVLMQTESQSVRIGSVLGMPLFFYLLLLPGAGIFAAAEKISWKRLLQRPANVVTLLRPGILLIGTAWGALILQAGFPGNSGSVRAWGASILIALGFAADFLDGLLARREAVNYGNGEGTFGSWLDAESDAIAIALSGLSLTLIKGDYSLLLLPVLARHSFSLLFVIMPVEPRFPGWYRIGSKISAAILQFTIASLWIFELLSARWFAPFAQALLPASTLLILLSFSIETFFRGREALLLIPPGHRRGLLKSVLVYYTFPLIIAPLRFVRMKRLYRRLVPEGGMVFDVGAHIGNRIPVFRTLGASVHAFEPQPSCRALLEHWYGEDRGVQLHFSAVGKNPGSAPLFVSRAHPTLTSLDGTWVENRTKDSLFKGVGWEKCGVIQVSTLEEMIRLYGTPDFIKIDVEGHELQVLQGLNTAVRALSFEFLVSEKALGLECLNKIEAAGRYEFNFSPGESMRMVFPRWADYRQIKTFLEEYGKSSSGDVYARKIS